MEHSFHTLIAGIAQSVERRTLSSSAILWSWVQAPLSVVFLLLMFFLTFEYSQVLFILFTTSSISFSSFGCVFAMLERFENTRVAECSSGSP